MSKNKISELDEISELELEDDDDGSDDRFIGDIVTYVILKIILGIIKFFIRMVWWVVRFCVSIAWWVAQEAGFAFWWGLQVCGFALWWLIRAPVTLIAWRYVPDWWRPKWWRPVFEIPSW